MAFVVVETGWTMQARSLLDLGCGSQRPESVVANDAPPVKVTPAAYNDSFA